MSSEARVSAASACVQGLAVENNYFTEMCSGSEAGSYLRRIDFVYYSTLDLRVFGGADLRCQRLGVMS